MLFRFFRVSPANTNDEVLLSKLLQLCTLLSNARMLRIFTELEMTRFSAIFLCCGYTTEVIWTKPGKNKPLFSSINMEIFPTCNNFLFSFRFGHNFLQDFCNVWTTHRSYSSPGKMVYLRD